ncbi:MAG: hypothetical protein HYX79_05765 [Chloroflexi bacterium]|nr:hypothetical protein [Chloroflexota bacterium]
MEYKVEMKEAPGRGKVEVLGPTFEGGLPEDKNLGDWERKLENREERVKYLKNALRYWYSPEGFGSEKRKNPA